MITSSDNREEDNQNNVQESSYVEAKLYKALIRAVMVAWGENAAQSLPNRLQFANWLSKLFDVPENVHIKIVRRAIQQNASLAEEFRQLILGVQGGAQKSEETSDFNKQQQSSSSSSQKVVIPKLVLRTKRTSTDLPCTPRRAQPSTISENETVEEETESVISEQPISARSWAGQLPTSLASNLDHSGSGSITSRQHRRGLSAKNKQSPIRSAADPSYNPSNFSSQNEYGYWQKTEMAQLKQLQANFEKLPLFNGALQVTVQKGGNLKQQPFLFQSFTCGDKQIDGSQISPYCMVYLKGGRSNRGNREIQRTPVIRGTSNPHWDHRCKDIVLEDLHSALEIEVRHDDPLGSDAYLGRQRLWIEDIAGDPDREWMLPISKKNTKKRKWQKQLQKMLGSLTDEKPFIQLYLRLIMEDRSLPENYNAAKIFALSKREALDGLRTLTEAVWQIWMGGREAERSIQHTPMVVRTGSIDSMAPSRLSSMLASIDRVRGNYSVNMDDESGTRIDVDAEEEEQEEWVPRRRSVDWNELARRLGQLNDMVPELELPRLQGFGQAISDIDPQEDGTRFFPSKSHRQILQTFSMLNRIHPIQAILELLRCMMEDWKPHPGFIKGVHALWRCATQSSEVGGVTSDQMLQYREERLSIVNRCDQVLRTYRDSFPKSIAIEGLRSTIELLKITLTEDSQAEFVEYVKRRIQDAVEAWIRNRKVLLEEASLTVQQFFECLDFTISESMHCSVMDLDLQMAFPQSVLLPLLAARIQYAFIQQVVIEVLSLQNLRSRVPNLRSLVQIKIKFDSYNQFLQKQELGDFEGSEGINLISVDKYMPQAVRVWLREQHVGIDMLIEQCIAAETADQKIAWYPLQELHSISVEQLFNEIKAMLVDLEYYLKAYPQVCGEVILGMMDISWVILLKYMSKLEEIAFELLVQNITQEQVEEGGQSVHSVDLWDTELPSELPSAEGKLSLLSFNDSSVFGNRGRETASPYVLPRYSSRSSASNAFVPERGTERAMSGKLQSRNEYAHNLLDIQELSLNDDEGRYNTDDDREGEEDDRSLRRSRSSLPWSMDLEPTQSGSVFVNLDTNSTRQTMLSALDLSPKRLDQSEKLPTSKFSRSSRTGTPTFRNRNIHDISQLSSHQSFQQRQSLQEPRSKSRRGVKSPMRGTDENNNITNPRAISLDYRRRNSAFNMTRSSSPTKSVQQEDEGMYGGWETPLSTVREIYHQSAYKLHIERDSVATREVCVILNNLHYITENCAKIQQQLVDQIMKDKLPDSNERIKIRMKGEGRFNLVKDFSARTQLNIIGCIYRLLKGELANKITEMVSDAQDTQQPLLVFEIVEYIQGELNVILRSTIKEPCSKLVFHCWQCILDTLCGMIVGNLGIQSNSLHTVNLTEFAVDCIREVRSLFELEELVNDDDLEKSFRTFNELKKLSQGNIEDIRNQFEALVKTITRDRLNSRSKSTQKSKNNSKIKITPNSVGIRQQKSGVNIPDLLQLVSFHLPNLIAKNLFKRGLKLAKQMPLQVIFGLPPEEYIVYHCACVYTTFEVAGTLFLTTNHLAFTTLYLQKGGGQLHTFAIPLSQIVFLDTLKVNNNRALLVQQFDEVNFVFYKFYQGQRDKFLSQVKQHLRGVFCLLDRTWSTK